MYIQVYKIYTLMVKCPLDNKQQNESKVIVL